jgi:hypothetical protein
MSLIFNANTDKVTLPDNSSIIRNVAGATVTAWINLSSKPGISTVASITIPGFRDRPRIDFFAVANDAVHMSCSGRAQDADAQGTFNGTVLSVSTGVWSFVACRCDFVNRLIKFNLNTTVETSPTITQWTAGNCSNTPTLSNTIGGKDANLFPLHGAAEDVRLYDRLLSDAELETLHACRGADSIFTGLQVRHGFFERHAGAVASGSETVRDLIHNYNGLASTNTVFGEGFCKFRRQQP